MTTTSHLIIYPQEFRLKITSAENNNLNEEKNSSSKSESSEEEYTPKLFSDDQSFQTEESLEKKMNLKIRIPINYLTKI